MTAPTTVVRLWPTGLTRLALLTTSIAAMTAEWCMLNMAVIGHERPCMVSTRRATFAGFTAAGAALHAPRLARYRALYPAEKAAR